MHDRFVATGASADRASHRHPRPVRGRVHGLRSASGPRSRRTFSFDDRQYFSAIQNLLRYYQLWQARGSQMIQEALIFRAQQAALSAWAANQAVSFFFSFDFVFIFFLFFSTHFFTLCSTLLSPLPFFKKKLKTGPRLQHKQHERRTGQVHPRGPSSSLSRPAVLRSADEQQGHAPRQLCAQRWTFATGCTLYVTKIVGNVYAQQDFAGAEYSWGRPGEGVRLLLGSDVTVEPPTSGRADADEDRVARGGVAGGLSPRVRRPGANSALPFRPVDARRRYSNFRSHS